MDEKQNRFNRFEKLLFRIHMGILSFGFILFAMLYVLNEYIREFAVILANVVVLLLTSTVVSFFIAIGRIVRYLRHFKHTEGMLGIKRTVIMLLTSPISFIVYFVIMLVLSLSMASCTYSG